MSSIGRPAFVYPRGDGRLAWQWFVTGSDDMLIRVFNYNTMEKVGAPEYPCPYSSPEHPYPYNTPEYPCPYNTPEYPYPYNTPEYPCPRVLSSTLAMLIRVLNYNTDKVWQYSRVRSLGP